jgi:integrase
MLCTAFADFLARPVTEITSLELEQWRINYRHEKKTKAVTINRYIAMLKAAINWGIKHEILNVANPMKKLEKLSEEDSKTIVRYFSPEERKRLDAALDEREERIRAERDNHNKWLEERGQPLLPSLRDVPFADYIKPMIIVSLNTGVRQGALFKLLWSDINFSEEDLLLRAALVKGKKDIHIPMNETLQKTLRKWKEQTGRDGDDLIFPSPRTGGVLNNVKKAWAGVLQAADIKNFRWHDLRHDFASQLVMKGQDLNTVRELMGHADIKTTLVYAHLAPKVKRAAVDLLG